MFITHDACLRSPGCSEDPVVPNILTVIVHSASRHRVRGLFHGHRTPVHINVLPSVLQRGHEPGRASEP